MVAVHLHVRTVFQEVHGFLARRHLRATRSAIAGKSVGDCGVGQWRLRHLTGVIGLRRRRGPVRICAEDAHDQQSECRCKRSAARPGPSSGRRTAAPSRAQDADRAPSAIFTGFDVEGNHLADIRAPAVARKRGNMDEDIRARARGRNEAEAAVVIPLRQRAVGAHDNVRDRIDSFVGVWHCIHRRGIEPERCRSSGAPRRLRRSP